MKKETLITVISTFLLTTLFWLFMFLIVIPPSKGKSSKTEAVEAAPVQNEEPAPEAPRYEAKAKRTVDYTESIVGHWEPVEVSSFKLDFSQYGTLKTTTNKNRYTQRTEYKYKLLGDRMGYTLMADFYEGDWHRIEITTGDDGATNLSIFDDPELGGRYRKQ
jgi:hypothetical protein